MYCPKCGYAANESDSFCPKCGCNLHELSEPSKTNNLQQTPQNTDVDMSTTKSLAQFVQSVTDMEIRAFTLDETAKSCREEAKKKEDKAASKVDERKRELAGCEYYYNNSINSRNEVDSFKKYCRHTKSAGRIVGFIFMHYFLGGFFFAFFATVITEWSEWSAFNTLMGCVGIAIYFTAFTLIWAKVKTKNHRKRLAECEQYVLDCKNKVNEAKKAIHEAEKELHNQKNDNLALYQKADELDSASSTIRENLHQCYGLGIIPPSYRNLLCAIIINDIFVNDKADSMRDAILLCDSEIRHGQLIDKLDDIHHSLNTLAASIQSLASAVYDLNRNIEKISHEVCNMSDYQERITYATESIQQSAKNTDFYVTQKMYGGI